MLLLSGGINMYIVIEHNFDNMENHNPNYSNIVGYVEDETSAIKWIEEKKQNINQHKGWDGEMYPYFDYKFIKKLL